MSSATSSPSATPTLLTSNKSFGGYVRRYSHYSPTLGCEMKFSLYVPPMTSNVPTTPTPLIYFLSGLTCTDENFPQKAGPSAYALCATLGIALLCPDTSPRGLNIEGDSASWDFGVGAGFYINAENPPWNKNYKMYDYITKELPGIVEGSLVMTHGNRAISGHSMGGLGSLNIYLKSILDNTDIKYKSCSAFAPISNPTHPECQWGQKAFGKYFGTEEKIKDEVWGQWDPTVLVGKVKNSNNKNDINILIDQGTTDKFLLEKQLFPQEFVKAAGEGGVIYREQEGYDHGYFFISTFIQDHIKHHAKAFGMKV